MSLTRSYTLRRRAEQQAETRRRITEAAVEMHGLHGPAHTTISQIAERAGVQRHTVYAHFPDERSLLLACSGMALERDPLPATRLWREIDDPAERLRTALVQLYGWYERNAQITACVLRDAEYHALTREIADLRYGPFFAASEELLGAGLPPERRPLLPLALSFFTWRTLVRDAGLSTAAAAETMAGALTGEAGRQT